MALPDPRPGLVIRYHYLWADQHARGAEEAGKSRPCVIVVAVELVDGERLVTVAPITHVPQQRDAIAIPAATKARLGLDVDASWIVCSEVNRFVWPGPDLVPRPRGGWSYGLLSGDLFRRLRDTILVEARRKRLRLVHREL